MASPPGNFKDIINYLNEEKYDEAEKAITGDDDVSKAIKALIISKSDGDDSRIKEMDNIIKSLNFENNDLALMICYSAYIEKGYYLHAKNLLSKKFGATIVDDTNDSIIFPDAADTADALANATAKAEVDSELPQPEVVQASAEPVADVTAPAVDNTNQAGGKRTRSKRTTSKRKTKRRTSQA